LPNVREKRRHPTSNIPASGGAGIGRLYRVGIPVAANDNEGPAGTRTLRMVLLIAATAASAWLALSLFG
jgi:hypothetical protein